MNDSVIVIVSVMRPGGTTGVQSHVQALADRMTELGRAHRVVTPFDAPRWLLYPIIGARRLVERVSPTAAVWWYRAGHALLLRRVLRSVLADLTDSVVYAQCPVSANAALVARGSPQQTVTMAVHFNVSQADEWAGKGDIAADGRLFRAIRRFEADVLPRLDALVFVSAFMHRQLLARVPALQATRAEVIPNFVGDPGPPRPIAADEGVDLVAVGTLEPRKNQGYLLDILAEANRLGRRLTLTIVGDGPDRATLQVKARALGVDSQVTFAGFVPRASRLLTDHRACIHVARLENLSMTLIESLAHGRPVFAPAVGGNPEIFVDGAQGQTLPLDDAPAAARLLVDSFAAPGAIEAMSRSARQRYLDRFETSIVGERLWRFIVDTESRAPRHVS